MAHTVTLTGFPAVLRARVISGSGAEPGVAIVDTVPPDAETDAYPDVTTLTIGDGTTTLSWSDMRLRRAPKNYGGFMRVVLEDQRWKLKHCIMSRSWNLRDSAGQLFTASQKTIAELCTLLTDASGCTVTDGGSDHGFDPPAEWHGKTGTQCLQELLSDSVSRAVYNPANNQLVINGAGLGANPVLTGQLHASSPGRSINTLRVESAPILYETTFSASAVVDDAAGAFASISNPHQYFENFKNVADVPQRERLRQSAFRLWQVSDTAKELVGHRALSIAPGAKSCVYAAGELQRETIAGQMIELKAGRVCDILHVDDGAVFITQNPFLQSNGSGLLTSADLLTGYYNIVDGERERAAKTSSLGASGGTRTVRVEWLRPIDSSQSDMPSTTWDALHDDVLGAYVAKYTPDPQLITYAGLFAPAVTGRIGWTQYNIALHPRPEVTTKVAYDFDPPTLTQG